MSPRRRSRGGRPLFWARREVNGQLFGVYHNSPLWWALGDEPPGTTVTLDDGFEYTRIEEDIPT